VFSAAIVLITAIVVGAAYLIIREANSEKPQKSYGKIIAVAMVSILAIVVLVGYTFITYFG